MRQNEISFDIGGECFVRIIPDNDGFTLSWHDGLVNEWEEHFSNLSQVFARVSALAKCGEHKWGAGFLHDSQVFAVLADSFLAEVVK